MTKLYPSLRLSRFVRSTVIVGGVAIAEGDFEVDSEGQIVPPGTLPRGASLTYNMVDSTIRLP